jgi:type IV pilus assembly protein PilC
MAHFTYKAVNSSGQSYEGEMEAQDRFVVYRKIRSEGGSVVFVNEVKKRTLFDGKFSNMFGSIKAIEKITFARNLGSMIEAGLSVTRALTVMEKQSKNKKLKAILNSLNENISKGQSLSDGMKEYPKEFSQLFVSMVKAGEESGNLAGSLKVIAIQMDKSYALSRKVKGALIYPAVIFSVMVVIGVLMMVYMVPTLTATFKGLGVDLPLSTRIVIGISDFLRNHFLIVFLAVVAVIVTIAALLKTKAGSRAFDYFILHLPVIGTIVKEVNSARTTRTLSSLLSSGVDVVVALGVTEEVIQNSFYKEVLGKAHENIQKGDPISAVFIEHENLYPIFVGEMMNVGEETGKMADMLLGVAAYYEDEVDQKTKDMSTIIEPVLMVIIGIAVGIFAISMLAPTYSLVDKI